MNRKYTLYISLIILIAIAGCSQSSTIPSEKPSAEQKPAKQEISKTASDKNPDKSKFEDYLKARTKLVQQYRAYAENYYRLGKQQFDKFQIEMAGENLKIALRYNPNHRKAGKLLDKVQGLKGVFRGTVLDTVMSSGRSDARKGDEIHAGGPSSRSPEAADGCPQP